MKICFKCQQQKVLKDFYAHERMSYGHFNKCKECAKKDTAAHREKNIDKIRALDRKRSKKIKYKKQRATIVNATRKNHPEFAKAHNAVRTAIIKGALKRMPCEKCGSTLKIHAHHDDYFKPMDIKWLCATHHRARHRELGKPLVSSKESF